MKGGGIEFQEVASKEPYGTVTVFTDFYGNTWDLLEPLLTGFKEEFLFTTYSPSAS